MWYPPNLGVLLQAFYSCDAQPISKAAVQLPALFFQRFMQANNRLIEALATRRGNASMPPPPHGLFPKATTPLMACV